VGADLDLGVEVLGSLGWGLGFWALGFGFRV
jgi:hypothetical protein